MTPRQNVLFEDAFKADTTEGLILIVAQGRPLTKAQRTFNRLVHRIEDHRAQLKETAEELDRALAEYNTHIRPREQRQDGLRKELIRAIAVFLDSKRHRNRDRKILLRVLRVQFDDLMQREALQDEDLRALFERVYNVSIEELEQESTEEMRGMFEAMCSDLGVDIDMADFPHGMTEEQFAAKAAEVEDEYRRKTAEADAGEQPGAKPRARTKKQMEREERRRQAEEIRKRSIASVYKQLARVLHPDLEQDPQRRTLKSSLMQKLTAAYRENDLHTLLSLELEWIQQEEGDLTRMTDEKLAIYNQVLKDQVRELEEELDGLYYQPRFQPLLEGDDWNGLLLPRDLTEEREHLDAVIEEMEEAVALLRSPDGELAIREIIRQYHAEEQAERQMVSHTKRASRRFKLEL